MSPIERQQELCCYPAMRRSIWSPVLSAFGLNWSTKNESKSRRQYSVRQRGSSKARLAMSIPNYLITLPKMRPLLARRESLAADKRAYCYNEATSVPLPDGCEAQPEAASFRVQPDALW